MFSTTTAGLPLLETSTDALEQALTAAQSDIDQARVAQLDLIAELDRRQTNTGDGYRTMGEWVAARLDESPETARALVRTARSIPPAIRTALDSGQIGFARAAETTRLHTTGVADALGVGWAHDIAGLRRRVAAQHPVTPADEIDSYENRHVALQPNLDETSWRLWGQLPGYDGRIISKALTERADLLPTEGTTVGQRSADALTSISMDSLEGTTGERAGSATTMVTVFVNAQHAAPTNAQQGVVIDGGPRIGARILEAILCDTTIETTATTASGQLIDLGAHRPLPPEVRRTVLQRDSSTCTIDSCASAYRPEVHHIRPQAQGGDHRLNNLATLCWWHHHIAIHGLGMTIDPTSPPHRRRLLPHQPRRPTPTNRPP